MESSSEEDVLATPEGGETLTPGAEEVDEDIPEEGKKRKRRESESEERRYSDLKCLKTEPSPPSPPSTSCDREVSTILTNSPHSLVTQYSASSSLHTDLAITPSPVTTNETEENQANQTEVPTNRIVQPKFINPIITSSNDFTSNNSSLHSSPIIGSPLYSSPIISSPKYSPHSPGYNIPSPGSAFSIVSPRRRISCESENEAILGSSDIEMVADSSNKSREITSSITLNTAGINTLTPLSWPSGNTKSSVLDSGLSFSDKAEEAT